jgi:hypothetical protein
VAYLLQLDETTVRPYLRGLDLSREGRVVLYNMLHKQLCIHADQYINDPGSRLSPSSECFRVDLVLRDPTRRIVHNLHLVISDRAAQYGILRIVYAEDTTGPQR